MATRGFDPNILDEGDRAEATREKGDERPEWQKAIERKAYVTSSRHPTEITSWYETDPQTRPSNDIPRAFQEEILAEEAMQSFELKKSEWTAAFEDAYEAHREEIDGSFWMQFTPRELRMFGENGEFDEIATWIEDVEAFTAMQDAEQAAIDEMFEKILAQQQRARTGDAMLNRGFGGWFGWFSSDDEIEPIDRDEIRRLAELTVRGQLDTEYEDEIEGFIASERALLEQMRAGEERPDESVPGRHYRGETDPYDRFFLSNGDVMSPEDHARFWDSETEFLGRLGDTLGEDIDITKVSDEEFEGILVAREQELRAQINSGAPQTLETLLTPGQGPGFFEGAMMGFGEIMGRGLSFGGAIIDADATDLWTAPFEHITMPILQSMADSAGEDQQETMRQIAAETGATDREVLARFLHQDTQDAFYRLEQEEPEMHREYLRMAGMDPSQALAFFQADLLHNNLSPEEQTKYLDDMRLQEDEILNQMDEADFTLGDQMLHILGVYGRNVPGRLSTMFTLLLTDQDIGGLAASGEWTKFFDEANRESEKYGHTPSAALGIDGSLAGLMLDLGSGIAFDPTTWLFGPRLGARGVQQATKSGAQSLAKSGMVHKMADDVIDFARSPSKGPAQMYQVADWLDPVSMGEFLNVVDFSPQTLAKTPWRGVKGHKAIEVRTDLLGKLIPDEVRPGVTSLDEAASVADDVPVRAKAGDTFGEHKVIEDQYGKPLLDKKFDEPYLDRNLETGEVTGYEVKYRTEDGGIGSKSVGEEVAEPGMMDKARANSAKYESDYNAWQEHNAAARRAESGAPEPKPSKRSDDPEIQDLLDDVNQNGFEEPLTVTLSRADESLYLSDGVKRVLAAETGDISHVPVRLRVADEAPAGVTKVPGYSDETVNTLNDIMKRTPDKKGANEGTREALLENTQLTHTRRKSYEVKSVELKNGETVSIRAILEDADDAGLYYAVNAQDEVVGVVQAGQIGTGVATSKTYAGNRLMTEILDAAHDFGDDLVNRLQFTSLSEDGAAALQKYAQGVLDNAVPQTNKAGFPIRELLGEGEDLAVPLRELGEAGEVITRPDAVLPKSLLSGLDDSTRQAVQEIFERAIVERGAVPSGSQHAAVMRHSGEKIRKLARANAPGRWVQKYARPGFVGRNMELTGVNAIPKFLDSAYFMWGDDTAKLNSWLDELVVYQRETAKASMDTARELAELAPRAERLRHMREALGGKVYDEPLDLLDDIDLTDKNALRRLVAEEEKYLQQKYLDIDQRSTAMGNTDKLDGIYQRMWEDYNRTYIATNPLWKDLVDPDTGLVPWEQLGKGKIKPGEGVVDDAAQAAPSDMQRAAEQMGLDAEDLMQTLLHSQNTKLTAKVPVSPLELVAARELGGAAYTRFTHWSGVSQLRETAMGLYALWRIDKVFTVATAATVSFDELLRIFHTVGMKSQIKWIKDRALHTQARAAALLHGKKPMVREGAEFLSPKAQERLRVVHEQPTHIRQTERMIDTENSLGWMDISPTEHGYDDAARQWTGGMLQDTGFRAFLRGEDSFREWFLSPDGERLRRGTVINGQGESLIIDAADEYYKGFKSLFDDIILREAKKAGKYDEVRNAWLDIANRIDETGGRPHDLPHIAYKYLGPVRGVKRDVPNKLSVSKMQEGFFDRLFMDPVNYRRGFLADLTRTHEKSRLTSLFHSQGKRIVSDTEVEAMLGLRGLAGAQRAGLREAINDMAVKAGVIPESYLDDLVERAVIKEIDNTLYTFDQSSRLGQQAKVAFPFGKPWADMAGYWGREMVRKPVMRGWINKTNAMWLRSANEKGLLSFPLVPNRGSALLSRLAHTDFNIDKGIMGDLGTEERNLFGQSFGDPEGMLHSGGLLPGSEESDFSPIFFLPTKGVNPFSYMIPGLGIVPIAYLDYMMAEKYDPVDEPEEYAKLQDDIGQIIPSVHFQQGGPLSRILGGGSTAKIAGMAVDLTGMAGQDSFFNVTSELGDITREIDRTREISALLADPEELQLLIDAKDPEEAALLLQGLAIEADKRASGAHLADSAFRFMAPVKHKFNASLAEIENVWIDAAGFKELDYLLPGNPEDMTDEQRRQAANDIRDQFFQLEPWQRDALVVEQPSLAVNMVGSWEWTPKALNEDLAGTQYSYRTGGTPKELARHEAMVRMGFVRPVQPIVRARRILGVIDNAKKSAAKQVYLTQLDQVNGLLWEAVPEEEKAKLEWVLDTPWAEEWGLETVEEVWKKWRTLEEDLELWLAEQEGIEPERGESRRKEDLTEFDNLRSAVKIPEDWKPWGTNFTLEEEDIPDKVNEWEVIEVDEKSARLAEALGLTLNTGMTGEELFYEVQQMITQRTSPVFDLVRPTYDLYIGSRTSQTGRNKLFEAAQSDLTGPEFQERIHKFLFRDEMVRDRSEGRVSRQDQDKMREEFMYIMHGAKEQKTDWEGIWDEQFARRYGPLDWEEPEPKSPFDENGDVAGGVTIPSIRHIVDGDTVMIQEYPGAPRVNSVRLLGLRTEELNGPNAQEAVEQKEELQEAILQGIENGDRIFLVRDDRFGNTDYYGRMLAWLWIGDKPYYKPEHLSPTFDPTGGDE